MKYVLCVACLLVAASASAQPRCRTLVLPDQGDSFNTRVVIPPTVIGEQLTYPVVYTVPANAVSVGLEFWLSRIQLGVPFDSVSIHGYHIEPNGKRSRTVARNAMGTNDDWRWDSFALSTVMHAGEQWVLGIYNGNPFPIFVDVAITIRECTTP